MNLDSQGGFANTPPHPPRYTYSSSYLNKSINNGEDHILSDLNQNVSRYYGESLLHNFDNSVCNFNANTSDIPWISPREMP
jgi:hypothetical protein